MKAAVREVAAHLSEHSFVFRTDVKGYYASIDQEILFEMVRQYVTEPPMLDLIRGYLRRFVSDGGEYEDITKGISLGCPLSPLMGALFLKPLDHRMAQLGLFYTRFMDDWLILAPTRWKLRGAIKLVHETMRELRLSLHPDKTFIGRIGRGFDFLGYWFSPLRLGVVPKTLERFVERVSRLYEQGAVCCRIGEYVRRWWRWVRSGVRKMTGEISREGRGGSGELTIGQSPLSPCTVVPSPASLIPYLSILLVFFFSYSSSPSSSALSSSSSLVSLLSYPLSIWCVRPVKFVRCPSHFAWAFSTPLLPSFFWLSPYPTPSSFFILYG